eukprot:gene5012-10027_t
MYKSWHFLPFFLVTVCYGFSSLRLFEKSKLTALERNERQPMIMKSNTIYDKENRFQLKLAKTFLSISLLFSTFYPQLAISDDSIRRGTVTVEDGETARIYRKALQTENDGDLKEAQTLYEQVVQVQPDFIDAWSNLGNVLTAQGNMDDAMLCYRKAISLAPPPNVRWVILLNKASIELATGRTDDAMRDLTLAEKYGGSQPSLLTTKAVAYSNIGKWDEACAIFDQVISTADRNALPWWLRYSMSLLEVGRGTEAVAYLQRTLNRFPEEGECNAFSAALYTGLGSTVEASKYWNKLTDSDKTKFRDLEFVSSTLKWGPKATKNFKIFIGSSYAN